MFIIYFINVCVLIQRAKLVFFAEITYKSQDFF